MMDYSFLILLVSMVASRWILFGAFQNLTEEERVKVLTSKVIRLSQITMVTTIIMLVVFYFSITAYPDLGKQLSLTFFGLILLQRIFAFYVTRKSMISNNIPRNYQSKFFISWLITTAGVIAFVFLLLKGMF